MEQWAILKTLSGSSPIFALSIHTTFSQTQTGTTVPLNYLHHHNYFSLPEKYILLLLLIYAGNNCLVSTSQGQEDSYVGDCACTA
jgi:hypothetical protein